MTGFFAPWPINYPTMHHVHSWLLFDGVFFVIFPCLLSTLQNVRSTHYNTPRTHRHQPYIHGITKLWPVTQTDGCWHHGSFLCSAATVGLTTALEVGALHAAATVQSQRLAEAEAQGVAAAEAAAGKLAPSPPRRVERWFGHAHHSLENLKKLENPSFSPPGEAGLLRVHITTNVANYLSFL